MTVQKHKRWYIATIGGLSACSLDRLEAMQTVTKMVLHEMNMPLKTKNFNAEDLLEFAQAERMKERNRIIRIMKEAALDVDSLIVGNFVKEIEFRILDGEN
jgi:hypothetical protein